MALPAPCPGIVGQVLQYVAVSNEGDGTPDESDKLPWQMPNSDEPDYWTNKVISMVFDPATGSYGLRVEETGKVYPGTFRCNPDLKPPFRAYFAGVVMGGGNTSWDITVSQ